MDKIKGRKNWLYSLKQTHWKNQQYHPTKICESNKSNPCKINTTLNKGGLCVKISVSTKSKQKLKLMDQNNLKRKNYKTWHENKHRGTMTSWKRLQQENPLAPFLFLIIVDGWVGMVRVGMSKILLEGIKVRDKNIKVNML